MDIMNRQRKIIRMVESLLFREYGNGSRQSYPFCRGKTDEIKEKLIEF